MAQLITREELALVLDEDFSTERFDALYRQAIRVVRTGYRGDLEALTDREADVVAGVLFGVMVRIASNPKGARQLSAGAAAMTFGGSDVEVSAIFSLTEAERADLSDLTTAATGGGAFTIRPVRS